VVICLEQGANALHLGPADATANSASVASLNPEWFTFLVPAYLGCLLKRPL